ncbi:Uncharacterised protein [Slackia heliotrinireducens]|uniref:DUF4153 domain-containing protein n=1 Tax=Slackia heliotrinireducens TaxID=84110 RepID=UPI000A016B7E|nr:DUF4173 domain-containing protein [Slackia heliotrinireducens]VEH00286.1 Uncharacterised protein [Slackia heliotrinireducens]
MSNQSFNGVPDGYPQQSAPSNPQTGGGAPVPPVGWNASAPAPAGSPAPGSAPQPAAPAPAPAAAPQAATGSQSATAAAPQYAPAPQAQPVTQPAPQYATAPGSAPQPQPQAAFGGGPNPALPLKPPYEFTQHDTLVAILGLVQAIFWVQVFDFDDFPWYYYWGTPTTPGIGIAVLTCASLVLACIALGKRARYDRWSLSLMGATAVVSVLPALTANGQLRFFSCLVLLGLYPMAMLALSGMWNGAFLRMHTLLTSWGFTIRSMFYRATWPMKAVFRKGGTVDSAGQTASDKRLSEGVLVGVLISCGLLVVVLPLLASADAVFGHIFGRIGEWLARLDIWDIVGHLVYLMLAAAPLAALLWNLTHDDGYLAGRQFDPPLPRGTVPPATVLTVLVIMDTVYLLFAGVQVVYLFGGVESPVLADGYAAYARQGFFQLILVVCINVVMTYVGMRIVDKERGLVTAMRAFAVLLQVLTLVVLVSSLWRMTMYVQAYGFSMERALTYVGMAWVAVVIVALTVRLFYREFKVFAVAFVAGLALWIGFSVSMPATQIANYNVDHYLAGDIADPDVDYLSNLSYESKPAIERLYAATSQASIGSDAYYIHQQCESVLADSGEPLEISYSYRDTLFHKEGEGYIAWQYQCLPYWVID